MVRGLLNINLSKNNNGKYFVKIYSQPEDKEVEGSGFTPHQAYESAVAKLVIKPWLTSQEDE